MPATAIRRYAYHSRAPKVRGSIVASLETLGVDWPDMRRSVEGYTYAVIRRGKGGFWQRHEKRLDDLAYEIKRAYHRAIKQVRHDFPENKTEAQAIIGAYQYCVRSFAQRGIEI